MATTTASAVAATSQYQQDRARDMWRRCLASAFRTALACTIVGVATLYGPGFITRHVAFPAFSYVTVILIVTDATLGDTLRGCWLALYATALGVFPGILSLWLIGPGRLTAATTSAVVAVSAFVVALPEGTHLVAKRIALGQIVLVYVVAFINGGRTEPVMHPLHLAASTALGVAACVLALLLPFPSLAYWQVTENCKLYIDNASERLKLFVRAFSAEDKSSPKILICQAKSLNKAANKFLHCIKSKQESMEWEREPIKFLKSYKKNPAQPLQGLETILRGMENALENCSEFPVSFMNDAQLKHNLSCAEEQILNQVKNMAMQNSILPQSEDSEKQHKFLQTLQPTSLNLKDLPSLFFLFCLKLLHSKPSPNPNPDQKQQAQQKETIMLKLWSKGRLMPALRCSLSLGFAVFFGLIYSKENGFWSGLPVAISLASSREATFKVANIKAQGTVLGTVYGVIGCFVFESYVKIRFVSLLPWFIFSCFLRQSRMYGQAGGVSAVIGALLILGRKNFGTPGEFAIARITETFIGLSCSIMVDILLQPTRASALAKVQLAASLGSLHEAVEAVSVDYSSSRLVFEERMRKLRIDVIELGKFIEEAEVEPNFWFLPFHGACYVKMKVSLLKMIDFLHFGSHAVRFLEQECRELDSKMWREGALKVESDLKVFKDAVCCGVKCFEEVILVKSVAGLEGKGCVDLEMGKSGGGKWLGRDEDGMRKSAASFMREMEGGDGVEEGKKNRVVLSLGALVYCMDGVLRESKEIEKGVKEVLQWENPSNQVDVHNIVCKLRALKKGVN
ncbi:hypothetical protein SASPL_152983 [Salvia splendens]|uniref:Integral membrane bound transporter domain-containing protein n=2 Tax=Salvia splendens TaxID=180675 RepID=A0A8X8W4Q9_SALSN|nr:hypothetical protein SASPL_152983 [Salvia splendens]